MFRILFSIVVIFVVEIHAASVGVEQLQTEIIQLKTELKDLKFTVTGLQFKMESNLADQFADKTAQSIKMNQQKDGKKFWHELLAHVKQTDSNRTDELLTNIVMNVYDGKRLHFYPLLEFIIKNNVTQAYPKLFDTLVHYNHIFDGQEIFILARYLLDACGENTELYKNLPLIVRQLVSGPVLLKNRDNMGYIIGEQHTPCLTREECYGQPKTEAFVHKLSKSLKEEDVVKNPRAYWKFTIPVTMDMKEGFNGTRMAWGFHLKNVAENQFLIAKLRMTTFFLRNDTNFDSYYKGDMQCQFQPMLIQGLDKSIKLALVEKWAPKVEFLHASHWGKKGDKKQLGSRQLYGNETEGLTWDVVVPERDENDLEENVIDGDTMTNSKCQF